MCKRKPGVHCLAVGTLLYVALLAPVTVLAQTHDPGVRASPTDGGPPVPLAGLTADELAFFQDGLRRFQTLEVVSGATSTQGNGLGPRFNSNSCASCHAQPYVGGTS